MTILKRPQPVLPLIDLDNQSVGIEGGARRGAFQKNNDLILYYFSDAKTLYENFQRGLAVSDNGPCLGYRKPNQPYKWISYKQVSDRAEYLGSCLLHKGYKSSQDQFVGIFAQNRPEWVISELACYTYSMVAVPLYDTLGTEAIIFVINRADIPVVICDTPQKATMLVENVEKGLTPGLKTIILMDPFDDDLMKRGEKCGVEMLSLHDAENIGKENFKKPVPPKPEDLSVICFTSGTTGEPKMVAHDFTYPLGHIVTGSFWHNLTENSLHLTIADTGWGKAVWGKLYGQWIAGANIFVYDHEKFTPAAILEKIQDYHVTSLCAPPTIFRFLIHEDLTKYDLSSLQYCTIAGEALNPAVFETFKKLTGIKLMEGFGQTETTLTIATMPWMEPKPGSMGLPNPQYDVDLIDNDGRSVEAGEQGQIVIRTDKGKPLGLFKEYYRDPERTHEAWNNGIYYTGDVAWKDEDGYLWFVGRADDVIKSSGYRIGPFEVESALMTHPAVIECAITGVPDDIRGQVVKATIVLAKEYKGKEGEALIKELQDHVKKVTAPYKYPRVIEFVDELPKTISGKIRRVEIRKNDTK